MVNRSHFFLLSPVRWALETRILDTSTINFKPPEALEGQSTTQPVFLAQHAKFVWKFGVIMYLLISKVYPFTFAEANGNNTTIDARSAKKFAELIRYRLQVGLNWNSTLDPINQLLKRALVCDPNLRIAFKQLRSEFGNVYDYYKPKEEAINPINLLTQSTFKAAGITPVETRHVYIVLPIEISHYDPRIVQSVQNAVRRRQRSH